MRSRYARCVFTVLLITLPLAASARSSPAPLWTASFDHKIEWQVLAPSGHLLVGSDEGLIGLDPGTGKRLWTMENLKDLQREQIELVPLTPYAVIHAKTTTMVIDCVDGTVHWGPDKLDFQTLMGQFVLPEVDGLLVYGRKMDGETSVALVGLADGERMWERPDFFKNRDPQLFQVSGNQETLIGNQEPLFDTNETMIVLMNNKAIRKWNARSGELLWQTEVKCKVAPALRFGYAPMLLNDDASIVYVPADLTLHAIRTIDGSLVWSKPPKLDGIAMQMQLTPSGLLVRGGPVGKKGKPFMMLLDPETGANQWKKVFDKLDAATAFVVLGDRAFVCSDRTLSAVRLADGRVERIVGNLAFKGNESPSELARIEDDLYVSGTRNMMRISPTGEIRYFAFYTAPSGGLLGRADGPVSTPAFLANRPGRSSTRRGRDMAVQRLIERNRHLSQRDKAATNAHDYQYILTNLKTDENSGTGLVKVNKATGEAAGQRLFDENDPVFEIDPIVGRMFYVRDKRQILCFSL